MSAGSRSSSAAKMKRYRERKAASLRVLRVEIPAEILQELTERGALDWFKSDDEFYLARRLGEIFTDAVGNEN